MKFTVKTYGRDSYKELIIKSFDETMESGLLNEAERRDLAAELQSAAVDLLDGLEVPA